MLFAIEEDLWFGDTSEREAESLARQSAAYHEGCEAALHTFPDAARRLLELPQGALAADAPALVATLDRDPHLCARVVRLANSAAFSGQGACSSVAEAVKMLGPRTVSEVAIAAAMFEAVHNGRAVVHSLRDHAASVAGLARFLALQLGVHADDVYAAALLHDIGKLFLWQSDEGSAQAHGYTHILEESDGHRDYAFILERRRYGFDHATLAGQLLKAWRLPEPIPTVVRLHHNPARAYELGGQAELMVSLIRLADRLAYDLQHWAGQPTARKSDRKLVHEVGQDESSSALGFTDERIADLWDDLQVTYVEGHALFAEQHS